MGWVRCFVLDDPTDPESTLNKKIYLIIYLCIHVYKYMCSVHVWASTLRERPVQRHPMPSFAPQGPACMWVYKVTQPHHIHIKIKEK